MHRLAATGCSASRSFAIRYGEGVDTNADILGLAAANAAAAVSGTFLVNGSPTQTAVAERAGWGKPAPQGVYRGLSQHMGYGSYVAAAAEVSVTGGNNRMAEFQTVQLRVAEAAAAGMARDSSGE